MNVRIRIRALLPVFAALVQLTRCMETCAAETPNVVIIFADDLGYADITPFGAKGYDTPYLSRMADEGMKFTSFYVSQAVCGASRASLLTGCYANRLGMLGAPGPKTNHGIHEREVLIPEICKQKGYATAMFGKWHLGHRPPFLPVHHGFDEYFGLPYSNDMWPFHPQTPEAYPDLPLIEGDKVVHSPVTADDQPYLTTQYTERAVKFIDTHKDQPFFLYVAHAMPHVPLFVSEKFRDKTERGLFGNVVSEVDWSVGEILNAVQKNGLDNNTLVIFSSDNGPWLSYGNHAGSAGPLREGKGTMFEGGVRVPTVMRWPGKVPAGQVCDEMASTIDVLPTIAHLIGAELPQHPIDGRNIWPLLAGEPGATNPREAHYFYWGDELQAIRVGNFKLHLPHEYRSLTGTPGKDGQPGGYSQAQIGLSLYDLSSDVGETTDVKERYPDVVQRLQSLAEQTRAELGDKGRKGSGYREPGQWREE